MADIRKMGLILQHRQGHRQEMTKRGKILGQRINLREQLVAARAGV